MVCVSTHVHVCECAHVCARMGGVQVGGQGRFGWAGHWLIYSVIDPYLHTGQL